MDVRVNISYKFVMLYTIYKRIEGIHIPSFI